MIYVICGLLAVTNIIFVYFLFRRNNLNSKTKNFNDAEHNKSLMVMKNLELSTSIVKVQRLRDHYQKMLRILCHDISSPLSLILLFSDSKNTAKLDFNKKEKIFKAATTMCELIQKIRDQEAVKSGNIQFDLIPFDLERAFAELCFVFEDLAAKKGVKIRVKNHCQDKVLGDFTSFKNVVLGNLISNAIKFSKKGNTIYLTAVDKIDHVLIEIEDEGVGIPLTILDKIYNGGKAISRIGTEGESGTGFGVSLAKTYIASYGGSLDIASETQGPQRGTTISIKLSRFSDSFENMGPAKEFSPTISHLHKTNHEDQYLL